MAEITSQIRLEPKAGLKNTLHTLLHNHRFHKSTPNNKT